MILYILVILFHLVIIKRRNTFILSIVSFLLLFSLMAFRDLTVGTDTLEYKNIFERSPFVSVPTKEYLWYLLNIVVHQVNGDFLLLNICYTLLCLIPIYVLFHKTLRFPYFGVLIYMCIYLYFNSFNAVRQGIAVGWSALAIYYLESSTSRKLLNYKVLLCFIVAVGFHITSIVIIPIYLLKRFLKSSEKEIVVVVFCLIFGLLFSSIILSFATGIIGYNNLAEFNFLGNFFVGLLNLLFFFYIVRVQKEKNDWYYYYAVFLCLSFILIRIPYGYRISMYAQFGLILCLGSLFYNIKGDSKERSFLIVMILMFLFYNIYSLFNLNFGEVLPYKSVLW